jgi:hypothetical protein
LRLLLAPTRRRVAHHDRFRRARGRWR